MTEPFKIRVERSETPEIEPQATQPKELVSDTLKGFEKKADDPFGEEEKKLEIWEGLTRKKFVNEYFDTHNTGDEFSIKMPLSKIDKYVREQLEELGYEKSTDNYKKILSEIETEIGSENLEFSKRFNKIVGYIQAIRRLKQAKALKAKYLNSTDDE